MAMLKRYMMCYMFHDLRILYSILDKLQKKCSTKYKIEFDHYKVVAKGGEDYVLCRFTATTTRQYPLVAMILINRTWYEMLCYVNYTSDVLIEKLNLVNGLPFIQQETWVCDA